MAKKKKKRKAEPVKYARGATWRDVLAGKPVTKDEVEAESKRGRNDPILSRCLGCKRVFPVVYAKGKAAPCECGAYLWRPIT